MYNDFIGKTVALLKRTDLSLRLPSIKDLNVTEDNVVKKLHLKSEDVIHVGPTPLTDNTFLHVMIFFGLLDAYIDKNNPQFEGYSFAQKYKNLPDNTDLEIIIKELYRFLKTFRNTAVHSKSKLTHSNNNILIDYHHSYYSTHFYIDTNMLSLELTYSAIIFLINNSIYPLNYRIGLLRNYYDDIKSNISTLKDDLSSPGLNNISSKPRLKRNLRYQIKNANYDLMSNNIIKIPKSENEDIVEGCEFDYIIRFNNKTYVLPNELLTNNNRKIEVNKLDSWILDI